MLLTSLLSFTAGVLTVLAPCVLPLLPVIVGGSLDGPIGDRRRPLVVAAGLVGSLVLFTVLLKVSTVLIGVDPRVWVYLSGGLVAGLGVTMLFPSLWARLAGVLGLEQRAQDALGRATKGRGLGSALIVGGALGPVFSSCSPTYAWVIASVLPSSPALGMLYLAVYCVGVAAALLAVALLGRRLVARLGWLANPRGWFQRAVGVAFILVGLSLVTGLNTSVQSALAGSDPFGLTALENRLVEGASGTGADPATPGGGPPRAPELAGIGHWINSDPLTISELRGKVVLIDFWTYSCINCQRTQPYLNSWYDRYHDAGLEIIGVHAPEFAFEQVPANVENAVREEGIRYPVALDNSFATWNAYSNLYWPAKYLIDKDGRIVYQHFGEGDYDRTEQAIRSLLGTTATAAASVPVDDGPVFDQTPETYLGLARAARYAGTPALGSGTTRYDVPAGLDADTWALGGNWTVAEEGDTSAEAGSTLRLRFHARDVYLVMDGPKGASVGVSVDGLPRPGGADVTDGGVHLDGPRLYRLVASESAITSTLTLTFPPGVTVNAFTFG